MRPATFRAIISLTCHHRTSLSTHTHTWMADMDAAKAADGEVPDFSSVVADMINDGEGLGAANTPLLQLNPGSLSQ